MQLLTIFFSFRVYSPIETGIRFKVADGKEDWEQTAVYETDEEVILKNQWQTVYLDLSAIADDVSFNHIFIFIGRGDSQNTTFYIDDFKGPYLQGTASVNDFNSTVFSIYPNPAKDKVYINNLNGTKNIRIFDINGRVIKEQVIESNELSIESLSNGLYFLEINGQVKKLLKK